MAKNKLLVVGVVVVAAAIVVAILWMRSGGGKTEGPVSPRTAAAREELQKLGGEAARPKVAAAQPAPGDAAAVPGGKFWRGHPDQPRPFGNPDTHPMRELSVADFRIDRLEVSVTAYDACVAAGACGARACDDGSTAGTAGDRPATCVSWDDATAYCAWAGGRLPTEAEWEKTARGTDGRKYPWGNDEPTCERASYSECGKTGTDAVGAHPSGASPFGAEDLAGNAAEWVADWYSTNYYPAAASADPAGPAAGEERVVRGGSFRTGGRLLMTGYRSSAKPSERRVDLGFRCVWPGS
jgi:formylglycine-generating enzyme required for sulfatase activity